ncbi:MAG: glucose-1-phosphate cytidylyltransferase [Fuerstiella sp.]|nr:glucose-1-phosphate cytidylyltransferase [Fuerstiella sp.]MCP4858863.1 glucose-1-phosphate cytidylyltransferase [Fuerstiella sp.]
MKAVILAGGLGTRLSEETHLKPKPMVEIGGRPILWHIMKIYSSFGINEFVVCAGYKGYIIKEYFTNYWLHMSDVTFNMQKNNIEVHDQRTEPWRVTIVDTGDTTHTGGRLKRVREYVQDETFCFTYGDGVGDINISELIEFHRSAGRMATLTAVTPPGRYGALEFADAGRVASFKEKPSGDGGSINGGFFVIEPQAIDLIENDATSWEQTVLEQIAADGQLSAYRHDGFWRPMDTLRDKMQLEELWNAGTAPWKLWD